MAREGERVGGYTLERPLGTGPSAIVWDALDADGRPVSLKLLAPEWARQADTEESFQRVDAAVRVHSRIDHPYLARAIAVVSEPESDTFGVVSERSPGRPLARLDVSHAAQDGEEPAELARLLFLLEELGEVVHWVHRADLVHGNLKPTNVIVQRGDFGPVPRLLDLSWSALGVVATPDNAYISPEQFAGQLPSAHSDQWAYGTLITRLLTSKRPDRSFGDVPDALIDCLQRCRAREVHQRYPSMREAVDDLRAVRSALERASSVPRGHAPGADTRRSHEPPVPTARAINTDTGDVESKEAPEREADGFAAQPTHPGIPTPPPTPPPATETSPAPRPWDVDVDAHDFRPRPGRWLLLGAAAILVGIAAALWWSPVPDPDAPAEDRSLERAIERSLERSDGPSRPSGPDKNP